MPAMLNIAQIGAGRMGRIHAANIAAHPQTMLRYVADPDGRAARALACACGGEAVDLDAIFADDEIDAVVVASPTDTHADCIRRAAASGKHVLCEKPVDLDPARVRECVARMRDAGKRLMVGFNRRFDSNFRALKDGVVRGDIGALELLCIYSKDPEPPPENYLKSAGGMLRDMTIHDFDLARFFLDEEPTSVSATAATLIKNPANAVGEPDTAAITLQCGSGKIAVITNSRRATYGYDQRVEAHGEKGMLSAGNILENTVTLANARGLRRAPLRHFFLERYAESYRAEWDAFAAALVSGEPPSPDGEDGLKALLLANAAYESLANKRTVEI